MKANAIIFRDEAENSLNQLALYIEEHSGLITAQRYIDRIYTACTRLTHFPDRGRRRDDILPGLRTIAFERRVTIAYLVFETHIEIVSITYGGRDFESELRRTKRT